MGIWIKSQNGRRIVNTNLICYDEVSAKRHVIQTYPMSGITIVLGEYKTKAKALDVMKSIEAHIRSVYANDRNQPEQLTDYWNEVYAIYEVPEDPDKEV